MPGGSWRGGDTEEDAYPRGSDPHAAGEDRGKDYALNAFGKAARSGMAGVLLAGVTTSLGIALAPAAQAEFAPLAATTYVNVRQGPGTNTAVLATLAPGDVVIQRGSTQGGWTPVVFQGREAWVFAEFLAPTQSPVAGTPIIGRATTTDYLNVRASNTTLSRVLGVLQPGQAIGLIGEDRGGWTPVDYQGRSAWVSTRYLQVSSSSTPSSAPTSITFASITVGKAVATDYLNVRSGAGTGFAIIGLLTPGQSVDMTGWAAGGWVPISYQGRAAFVAAAYVTTTNQAPTSNNPNPNGQTAAWSTDYVNVRTGPGLNYPVAEVVPPGTQVSLTGETSSQFSQVVVDGSSRWMATMYLSGTRPSSGTASTPSQPAQPSSPGLPAVIGTRYATDYLNIRSGSQPGAGVIDVAPFGAAIPITGAVQNGRAQVIWNGAVAWASLDYLSTTPPAGATSPGCTSSSGSLDVNGCVGLNALLPQTKQIVYRTQQMFPQIKLMYGVRPDSYPDHPSGHAVDLMLPTPWSSNVDLGWQIANYYKDHAGELGINYVIYHQQIWNAGDAGWTWMADRGSPTANHMDHVHVNTA